MGHTDLLIPRWHHAIWVGPKPFSDRHKQFLSTRPQFFPTWITKLWTDDDVKHLPLINRRLYDQVSNYGQKGDILRLELLYLFGGVCADVDFEFLSNFEHHLANESFVTARQSNGRMLPIGAGLMASTQYHPFVLDMIHAIPERMGQNRRIVRQTGPGLISYMIRQRRDLKVLPKNVVYPDITKCKDTADVVKQFPEAVMIHYGDRTWT